MESILVDEGRRVVLKKTPIIFEPEEVLLALNGIVAALNAGEGDSVDVLEEFMIQLVHLIQFMKKKKKRYMKQPCRYLDAGKFGEYVLHEMNRKAEAKLGNDGPDGIDQSLMLTLEYKIKNSHKNEEKESVLEPTTTYCR